MFRAGHPTRELILRPLPVPVPGGTGTILATRNFCLFVVIFLWIVQIHCIFGLGNMCFGLIKITVSVQKEARGFRFLERELKLSRTYEAALKLLEAHWVKIKWICKISWSPGFYLYITTEYDMSFPFEQGWGTRTWSASALGLKRNRGPRSITLHDRIFARDSAQIHHGRCRNTACRFTAKATCGYNVPMSVGT